MFEKFNKLRKLTIKNWEIDYFIVKLISQKSTIIDLDFNECLFTNEGLQFIGNMNNLENLNIQKIRNTYRDVSLEDPLISILCGCKNLKSLNINNLTSLTHVFDKIKRLKKLEILRMNNVGDIFSDNIFNDIYKLKILECAFANNITDEMVITLFDNCQELEELNISRTAITYKTIDYAFRTVEKRTNNIKLKITADANIIDEFIKNLKVRGLKKFYLSNLQLFKTFSAGDSRDDENYDEEYDEYYSSDSVYSDEEEQNDDEEEEEEDVDVVNVQEVNVQQGIGIEIEDSIDDSVFQNIDLSIYDTDDQNNPPTDSDDNNNNNNNPHKLDENINLLDEDDELFMNIINEPYLTNAAGNRIDEAGNVLDDDGNLIDSYADFITDEF